MSQSDEDDGLPQSPVPHVTTADLILGGGLKVLSSYIHWCLYFIELFVQVCSCTVTLN